MALIRLTWLLIAWLCSTEALKSDRPQSFSGSAKGNSRGSKQLFPYSPYDAAYFSRYDPIPYAYSPYSYIRSPYPFSASSYPPYQPYQTYQSGYQPAHQPAFDSPSPSNSPMIDVEKLPVSLRTGMPVSKMELPTGADGELEEYQIIPFEGASTPQSRTLFLLPVKTAFIQTLTGAKPAISSFFSALVGFGGR